MFVDDHHPVGVAVERDADVGAQLPHFLGEGVGRGRADVAVDVHAVRLDADRENFRAQFPQGFGGDLVGGAIGAIDDDAHALEGHVARQGMLGEFDIAGAHVIDAAGPAESRGSRQFRG